MAVKNYERSLKKFVQSNKVLSIFTKENKIVVSGTKSIVESLNENMTLKDVYKIIRQTDSDSSEVASYSPIIFPRSLTSNILPFLIFIRQIQ